MHTENTEESLCLGIYLEALKKRKKFICIFVGAALAMLIAACFVIPKKYEARASIMPPQQADMGGLAAAVSSGFGDLAGGLLGVQSTSDVWIGVLKSTTVNDAIIERFKLRAAYDTETIEKTREKLSKNITVEKSREEIVSVAVEDKDPRKAAEMANAFIEELDKVNKNVSMTSGARAKAFLEARLTDSEKTLAAVEEALRDFQKKNKALKLDEQSKALIESYSALKGSVMAKEIELKTFLSYATAENPKAQTLKYEIGELNGKLRELDTGTGGDGLLIPASRYPDLSIDYARILREVKVQQTLFELLTQQFEMSRIQEAKDSPTVQFLDVATAPEQEASPNKPVLIILGTALSIMFAVFIALFLEFKDHLIRRLL